MKKEGVAPASTKIASPASNKAVGKVAGKKRTAAEANDDDEDTTTTAQDTAAKKKSPAKTSPKKRKTTAKAKADADIAATKKGKWRPMFKSLNFRSNR